MLSLVTGKKNQNTMRNFGHILDAVALVLSIVCATAAGIDHNWTAMLGWITATIWIIRCKITED